MTARQDRISLSAVEKSWQSADRRFELHIPDFSLAAGEIAILTGLNGTGKTTLLELIGLASCPDRGRIELALEPGPRQDVSRLWSHSKFKELASLRATGFGYVLQSIHLLPFLSVRENAEFTQKAAGRIDSAHLDHLFDALGLTGRESALPETLSPGLRQRAAVARALAHRPRFIVADEPTAALDPEGGEAVIALLLSLARNEGAAAILSTHQRGQMDLKDVTRIQTRQVSDSRPGVIRAVLEREAA
ncbi:ABC transporter ATP-binding protein [Pelagibius sp. Alg239-R121]|uniref:ABC transporter ATP-binding protein n=1 Tax=Pelagibius sp. Alg239-R121 TaxID=2993448 RepID=UPI0024A61427|nr:ATP-binding cassette domain-containing protein [Pelagibius sp. Alg239-R121]